MRRRVDRVQDREPRLILGGRRLASLEPGVELGFHLLNDLVPHLRIREDRRELLAHLADRARLGTHGGVPNRAASARSHPAHQRSSTTTAASQRFSAWNSGRSAASAKRERAARPQPRRRMSLA